MVKRRVGLKTVQHECTEGAVQTSTRLRVVARLAIVLLLVLEESDHRGWGIIVSLLNDLLARGIEAAGLEVTSLLRTPFSSGRPQLAHLRAGWHKSGHFRERGR